MKFTEVMFRREEHQVNDNTKTVTFERVRVLKTVTLTQQEADMLNAGKTTTAGNIEFTLLMKEGDQDPESQTLTTTPSTPMGQVDERGQLISGSSGPAPAVSGSSNAPTDSGRRKK